VVVKVETNIESGTERKRKVISLNGIEQEE